MSIGAVFGPSLGVLASHEAVRSAGALLRVRETGESPVRRAAGLREMFTAGVTTVLLVDRAIPVRPDWAISGALFALVADHINLTGDNPLVGANADEWGPRFPDLTDAWDPRLRSLLREGAVRSGFELREGVLAGVSDMARTSAELAMFRMVGADMAGDGFVHEAIVARHAGRRVAGLAVLATGTELPGESAASRELVREAISVLAAAGSAGAAADEEDRSAGSGQ